MKRLLITLVIVCIVSAAPAQFFTGLNGSQYAGITTVDFNPAIANSRKGCRLTGAYLGRVLCNGTGSLACLHGHPPHLSFSA